ncbi:hypothetical protein H257_19170 [Aphanomyces astaci]|uniref:Uncharacterized protein n=1 Tax=Aphanomyces astaci TaxID=112090 RepID=W4F8W2_APHAT|nr:hypothetical protein H257_19170 [Aphanomyces astaci]ETV63897.1 hypothetical protein H257_19170 [Aphanomyces astaci]|eukprot:XP_009846618.1 hypothetical protein H257_19170 [Aphanomyces astaci]
MSKRLAISLDVTSIMASQSGSNVHGLRASLHAGMEHTWANKASFMEIWSHLSTGDEKFAVKSPHSAWHSAGATRPSPRAFSISTCSVSLQGFNGFDSTISAWTYRVSVARSRTAARTRMMEDAVGRRRIV